MPGLVAAVVTALTYGLNLDLWWPPTAVSGHASDPGTGLTPTAGTELSGSGYRRVPVIWTTGQPSGYRSGAALLTVPAGQTLSHVGYWRGSTWLGSRALGTGYPGPTNVTAAITEQQ